MLFRLLGDATMLAHFAFLLFAVFGGYLAWRWPRLVVPHLLVVAWCVGILVVDGTCPLTYVEGWARESAGQAGLAEDGFVQHYLTGVIYPEAYLNHARAAVGAVIAVSWLGLLVRWSRRRHRAPVITERTPAGDVTPGVAA